MVDNLKVVLTQEKCGTQEKDGFTSTYYTEILEQKTSRKLKAAKNQKLRKQKAGFSAH